MQKRHYIAAAIVIALQLGVTHWSSRLQVSASAIRAGLRDQAVKGGECDRALRR